MHGLITVVGSANTDISMRLNRLPRLGETVTDGELSSAYGGKGANQAVAAARAGGQVAFVGCLGDDTHGRAIQENCRRDGINTDGLLLRPGVPTGSALIMFDRQGDNYIAVAPGANHALMPTDIDAAAALLDGAAMLIMQMELPLATTRRVLERAAAHRVPVLFNFAPSHSHDLPITSAMTGLIVNEHEAEELCGQPVRDPETAWAAAQTLRQRGPAFVVVTLGAQGAVVLSAEEREYVPTFPAVPVDTTGAGDVFCGALTVALVEGQPLSLAARFAAAASALSVTRAGAQPSAPRRDEIDAFLQSYPA